MKTLTATIAAALTCTALISAPIAAAVTPTDNDLVLGDTSERTPDQPPVTPIDSPTTAFASTATGTGSISGRVTRALTGEPIANTVINVEAGGGVCSSQGLRQARTDADGYYLVTDVPAGPRHVYFGGMVEGPIPHFAAEYYNDAPANCSADTPDVIVVDGQTTTGIDAALEEYVPVANPATITGALSRDSRSTARIPAITVCAESVADPTKVFCGGSPMLDNNYEIQGIEPGAYRIHFLPSFSGDIQGEYYDNVTDPSDARIITLAPNEILHYINASLDDTLR